MTRDMMIGDAVLSIHQTDGYPGRPTIIFLHDSLGSTELWRDFPEKLGSAAGCNILMYDRQGYGKSAPFPEGDRNNGYMETEADVLDRIIRECGIKEAILFGHSDGGSIALIAAAKYPDRIKGIITEGAHIFVEEITLKGIREVAKAYRTTNLRDRLKKYHGDKTDAVFRAWAHTWLSPAFKSWNIGHFLSKIHCPVLIIQGVEDEYGSASQVNGIIQQVSGPASKLMIPSIGHTPHKQARVTVLSQAAEFIHRLVGGA